MPRLIPALAPKSSPFTIKYFIGGLRDCPALLSCRKDRPPVLKPSLHFCQLLDGPFSSVMHQRDGRPDNAIGEASVLRRFKEQVQHFFGWQLPARFGDGLPVNFH